MSKNFKRILAIVLAVLTLSACATLAVFATADETQANSGKVCRIGAEGIGTYYGTLADAVDNAKDGDVITVIKNVSGFSKTITKNITIRSENGSTVSGVSVTVGVANQAFAESKEVSFAGNIRLEATGAMFDLKSGTLTFKENVYAKTTGNYIVDNGNSSNAKIVINVKDNAELIGVAAATDKAVIGLFQGNDSEINISGNASITQEKVGSWVLKIPTDSAKTVNITGGTLTSDWGTISMYANDKNIPDTIYTRVNISGGTINADSDSAIMFYGNARNAELNISGDAVVTAPVKTLYVWSKNASGSEARITQNCNININGGTIAATKSTGDSFAIYVQNAKNIGLNINGGTVSSDFSKAIYAAHLKVGDKEYPVENLNVNISGGTITAPKWTFMTEGDVTGAITVSGGTVQATNGNKTMYLAHRADKMVTLDVTGGVVSANITAAYDTYDSANMDGQHAIFVGQPNASKVTISGGRVLGLYDTIDIRKVCDVEISGDAYIEAEHSYATNFTNVNLTMKGGTVSATTYTLGFLGGANTVNMTGGTLIATESTVLTRTASDMTVDVNISGDAKIYAATKALDVQSGITYNISGGLIDVANEYKLAEETNVYAIQMKEGTLNITGGKFILGGKWASAQMIYHASANTTGKSTVNGGLFINKNTANAEVLGTNVNYISGRILYGENITGVVRGHLSAPKSVKVSYGGEEYFFCTRYAATNEAYAGAMVEGAQIRMTKGSTGMRFTTTFDEIDGATYGTLIVPAAYLANLDAFTIEALEAAGFNYLNIIANVGMTVVDGKVTINAAITNILAENYGTAFAAIAYVEIDGVYYYTAFDIYSNARSVDSVAAAALDDLKAEADEEYKYAVTAYGTTVYSPYNAYQRGVLEGFLKVTVGVPRADGATLVNTGSGAYMYFSAGVNAEEYASYKASLAAVFEFVTENDLEGNLYTTYAKGEQIVTLAYTPNTKEMRVIMESTDNTSLVEDQDYTAPEAPVATTLTQIGQWYDDPTTEDVNEAATENHNYIYNYATGYNTGMGYVIRLEDGSFIVVDSGENTELHADNLYAVLKKQAGDGDIVIAAWIFTHAHADHTGAFVHFTEKYAIEVTVEKFIYNFPAEQSKVFGGSNSASLSQISQCMNKYAQAVTIIAHAGQEITVRNATINILFTYDMMQPAKLSDYNTSSTVFNIEVEDFTILFFGDADSDEMGEIMSIYSSATIGADIVQAAHHGIDKNDSDITSVYKAVAPDYVFVPCASKYVKVDEKYIDISQRSVYSATSGKTKYIAGDEVTVLTLGDGKVTTYDNVDAYKNS